MMRPPPDKSGDPFEEMREPEPRGDPFDAYADERDPFADFAGESGPGTAIGEVAGISAQAREDRLRPMLDAVDLGTDKFRAENVSPFSEAAPMLAGLGVSLALPPMAPWAAALAGLGTSAAVRGATPLLKGEGVDAALEEVNPLNHPVETALDVGVPFVGKAISNALRAKKLYQLPDYARAVSANADLPPVDELASFKELGETVSRDAVEPGAWGKVRSATAGPSRFLLNSDSPAAQLGGETLKSWGEMQRQVKNQAHLAIRGIFKGLSAEDEELVGAIMRGEVSGGINPQLAEVARQASQLLDQVGDRATQIPGMLTRTADGEMIPFRKVSESYFPRVLAVDDRVKTSSLMRGRTRLDPAQHQRTAEDQGGRYVTNARQALERYFDDFADDMAASHYFGPRTEGARWGEKADQIFEQIVSEGDPTSARIFGSRLEQIMNPPKKTPADDLFDAIGQKTAHVALGQSAITSFPQVAMAPMRYGYGNAIEGTVRRITDPSFGVMERAGGGLDPGVTNAALAAGVRKNTLPARLMRGMETGLRGIGNAGVVPYAEKLVAAAQKPKVSAATLRKLSELRIPLEEARGGMTADLMRRVMQRSADTNQLQAHAVENAPALFDSSAGKLAGQFMQFPIQQAQVAEDAVVRPIVSGLAHAQPSEVALGAGRLARWVPALGAAAGAAEVAKSAITGRDVEPQAIAARALETGAGLPGSVISNMMRGQNAVRSTLGSSPSIGIGAQFAESAGRLPDEPDRATVEMLIDLLAALDKTGTASVVRPSVRAYMKESSQ